MGSVVVLLVNESRADGKFPVKIRVGVRRKYSYETLCYIKASHWNNSAKQVHAYEPASPSMNQLIRKRYKEAVELVDYYQNRGYSYTAQDILGIDYADWKKAQVKAIAQAKADVPGGFIDYIRAVVMPHWKARKNLSNVAKYELEADVFSDYLKTLRPVRVDVPMGSFNVELVESYFAYLRTKKKPCRKDSTLKRRLSQIEAVLNFAHRKGVIEVVPDLDVELNVLKAKKPKLIKEQIDILENYHWDFSVIPFRRQLSGEKNKRLAVQTFLLQYYLYGARIGDALQLKNSNVITKNGVPNRIEYYQQKGRKGDGKKLMSIVLNASLLKIVSEYYTPWEPDAYLLPWMQGRYETSLLLAPEENELALKDAIRRVTSAVNKSLQRACELIGLDVPTLASHSARHSFAQRAKVKGKSIEWIKDAFGHSTYDITANYLADLDSDELNQAMQDVYD